ncbi:Panacea domain-containing protein [Sphingomonas sp. CFBP 8764]|uniref:Panacea domain-containing protein n=1 Tax=Sphingomonas sp. CFBP 8764 TaxID=2775275 RepID=UPI001783D792|nr:type II toxin-antitoxin system antitoxin SocA domain-containing protein [Sphingomonas sp. CFBP 8764]MBD8552367.1 DUF4065 domain-containing protein [Sphingomonas sp. CFBP 8764]
MVQPVAFANEIINRFGGAGYIDHMKLQKLLYFSNGWWLGLTGAPLLDERPQVWRYGPVFRGVYNSFSRFGSRPIHELAPGNPFFGGAPERVPAEQLAQIIPTMDWIWGEYGGKSAVQLSDETHAPGTPWQRIAAASNYAVQLNTEIPPAEDWQYFAQLATQRGWTPAPFNPNAAT